MTQELHINRFGDRFLGYIGVRGDRDLESAEREIQRYMPRGYTTEGSAEGGFWNLRLHAVTVWSYDTDDAHDRYVRDRLASGLWFLQDHSAEERAEWIAYRLQDDRLPFYTEDVPAPYFGERWERCRRLMGDVAQ